MNEFTQESTLFHKTNNKNFNDLITSILSIPVEIRTKENYFKVYDGEILNLFKNNINCSNETLTKLCIEQTLELKRTLSNCNGFKMSMLQIIDVQIEEELIEELKLSITIVRTDYDNWNFSISRYIGETTYNYMSGFNIIFFSKMIKLSEKDFKKMMKLGNKNQYKFVKMLVELIKN